MVEATGQQSFSTFPNHILAAMTTRDLLRQQWKYPVFSFSMVSIIMSYITPRKCFIAPLSFSFFLLWEILPTIFFPHKDLLLYYDVTTEIHDFCQIQNKFNWRSQIWFKMKKKIVYLWKPAVALISRLSSPKDVNTQPVCAHSTSPMMLWQCRPFNNDHISKVNIRWLLS